MRSSTNTLKHDLYVNAFLNTAKKIPGNPDDPELIKRLIFYGVKLVNTKPEPKYITKDETLIDFQFTETIQTLIGTLTPAEFVNIFPIEKDFKGHRYQTKDYFYAMDYIRTLPADEPIGDTGDVTEFLWEYTNWEVNQFSLNIFGYVDNLRKLEGQPSIMETFCNDKGIKTYTMRTDPKGRQFLLDRETGKSFRVKKRIPRYLKLVK